jgi:hypothetical protein
MNTFRNSCCAVWTVDLFHLTEIISIRNSTNFCHLFFCMCKIHSSKVGVRVNYLYELPRGLWKYYSINIIMKMIHVTALSFHDRCPRIWVAKLQQNATIDQWRQCISRIELRVTKQEYCLYTTKVDTARGESGTRWWVLEVHLQYSF